MTTGKVELAKTTKTGITQNRHHNSLTVSLKPKKNW